MAVARHRLTLEEFLQLPEQEPALEYWRGEVSQKMSPTGPHGALQFGLGRYIEDVGHPRRLARAFTETRITFGGVSLVPDLIVYLRARVPRDERGEVPNDFMSPPDIAVEIASPGQSRNELLERCRWYVNNGVRLALLADPRRRGVWVFRRGAELGPLHGPDRISFDDVLPGFVLTVDELFEPLRADWE